MKAKTLASRVSTIVFEQIIKKNIISFRKKSTAALASLKKTMVYDVGEAVSQFLE
jgi:hypothetical protein